ncbi:myrosinase 1-like [Agrilus planipennis]|uniref:Myrosinase 1-like n=1 Tax=Agrilus planipennis TaxID=224129 RepID=A0A1W4WJI8_AGRPL|nr:myrosinase 1-like [Agrilus planipennis]
MPLFNMFSVFIILVIFAAFDRGCWAINYTFPDNFLFGTATSSYQIEGAWNESGKGENTWDWYTHNYPERILDRTNGDIACDSYHKYEEDIKLLKELGVDFYRFSLSWTRIFPSGFPNNVNYEGINYYNKILNLLAANNITAMVTLFHWDLPQRLMELGGLTNPRFIAFYTEYARTAFEFFGDRVKYWLTFNEPFQTCMFSYGDTRLAPALGMSGIADYLCGHNLLKAHAAAYHLYNTTYRSKYEGKIAISISAEWFEPNNTYDEAAADRVRQFWYGIHMHPIFSSEGDYPEVVKEYIATQSSLEGYKRSRLPQFTPDEINYIKGTSDFMGLNHYNTYLATNASSTSLETSYYNDIQASYWLSSSNMEDSDTARIVPWGFRKLLVWVKNTFNDPEIFVTENGYYDFGDIDDRGRISFYGQYLEALLEAIYIDNVKVIAYTAWTLMDNFEWNLGYEYKYGIYYVNFTDPDRPRIPKSSAYFIKNVIGNRTVVSYDRVV